MDSILLVSSSEKSVAFFMETFSELSADVTTARTAEEARRLFLEKSFGLCVINAPLEGGGGELFARDAVSVGMTQVLLLVREEDFRAVSERCDGVGVLTLARPVNKKTLLTSLRFTDIFLAKMMRLREANNELVREMEDMRLVNRAKCILIQYLNMSEAQAHKYIEKQAMDMRLTRTAVAENILKTYES